SNTAVVPRETLARLYGAPGQVSMAYLKLKNPQEGTAVLQTLSEEYRRYVVREPFSRAEIQQYTQTVTIPFFIMLVLVLFISIFIIYSSFKVITRERLPIIGTFRSIGATRKMTDLVLLAESILYGTIGGIAGYFLGLGILYIMAAQMRPEWAKNTAITLIFTPGQVGAALILAVVLPLISSFFPIIKIAKLPVKEIIFNRMEQPKKRSLLRLFLGLCFLGFVLVAPRLVSRELALAVDVVSMLLAVSAVILLVPFLTAGFIKIFEWVYYYILGNEGVLAAKNLRENKSILNNIALLAIGISSLLMINTVSFSVVKEVANFYKDATFDLWMYSYQADRRFAAVLRSIDGVSAVYGVYGARGTELAGGKEKINLIHGIDTERYFDYWQLPLTGDRTKLLKELDADRNIMLSNILKDKLQVKEGDELVLKMKRGDRVYKVIGFFNSLMWGGSFGLVSERYLKWDMQLQYYDNIFIKTSQNPARVVELIKKHTVRNRPWIETLENMNRQDIQENRQLFLLLQGFAVMTLVIGLFGVFNNLMISFLERKRSLAMMRSVGMSRSQTLKMIFIEALTGGIIGGSVGLLAGTVLIGLVPFVLQAINQVVPIHYSLKEFGIAFLFGVIITVIASIGPALKSSRLNIIEAIKYE
ncbi:MAG TPA: FtsX-like permease family protein, partial [Bacillota bacterium]|nr:FtsX-like permease family protein [Bacillota bacterium]